LPARPARPSPAPRLFPSPTLSRSAPATVPAVDLQRYLGTWYEIARLPMRHEPPDYTDITATYTLQDDGKVRVENRARDGDGEPRSEEHTSELQSRENLVCRLLLEK